MNPGRAILLDGVSDDLYRVTVYESGFHHLGIEDVYLTAENGAAVKAPADQVLDPAVALRILEQNRAVVYVVKGKELRNITPQYTFRLASQTRTAPLHVEVGNPLYWYLLGPEWMAQVNDARWMPATATVRIGAPDRPGAHLSLEGWCVTEQLREGPLRVAISANGISLGEAQEREVSFRNEFALPDSLVGKQVLTLSIRVHPTIRVGGQDYGAMFTRFTSVNP